MPVMTMATECGRTCVQLRHVQASLDGEFVGAFELRGSGDEVHCHGFTNLDLREAPQRK